MSAAQVTHADHDFSGKARRFPHAFYLTTLCPIILDEPDEHRVLNEQPRM